MWSLCLGILEPKQVNLELSMHTDNSGELLQDYNAEIFCIFPEPILTTRERLSCGNPGANNGKTGIYSITIKNGIKCKNGLNEKFEGFKDTF